MNQNEPPKALFAVLTKEQKRVIPYLISCRTQKEAQRHTGISKATIYRWMQEDAFKEALECCREQMISEALNRLKSAITKAVKTLINLMSNKAPGLRLRSAQTVLDYYTKISVHDELEKRIAALEKLMNQKRGGLQ